MFILVTMAMKIYAKVGILVMFCGCQATLEKNIFLNLAGSSPVEDQIIHLVGRIKFKIYYQCFLNCKKINTSF